MFKIVPLVLSVMLASGATVATQNSLQEMGGTTSQDASIISNTTIQSDSDVDLNMDAPFIQGNADLETEGSVEVNSDTSAGDNEENEEVAMENQASVGLHADGFIRIVH